MERNICEVCYGHMVFDTEDGYPKCTNQECPNQQDLKCDEMSEFANIEPPEGELFFDSTY